MKRENPFFVFNPKSYLYGAKLLDLALVADDLAQKYPQHSIFMTVPVAEVAMIATQTKKIIVTAQHVDGILPGRGMGKILPESLYAAGARAVFLNHAEHPLTITALVAAVKRAKALGILTIVCADSIKEAQMIANLAPDIILCEPTELIGTGKTSDQQYIKQTQQAIRLIDPKILIMQAAGISSPNDVYRTIQLGADGTGCTSGITKAADPAQMLREMVAALVKASEE